MQHPQRGEVVLYSQGGKTYNALVLMAHSLTASHLGKHGEPTLHLAVLFEDLPGARIQIGSIPEPTVIHDVVHSSHEFDADYLESHGLRKVVEGDPQKTRAEAEIRSRRGAGEWTEAIVFNASDVVAVPEEQHAFRTVQPQSSLTEEMQPEGGSPAE